MERRRQFLVGVATAGVITIAGCSRSSSKSEVGPEKVVEQYITATQNGNTEAVNELLHPESSFYPRENVSAPDEEVTLNEVNQVSVRELTEQEFPGLDDEEEIQQRANLLERELDALENKTGVDESATVRVSWEQAGEEREQGYVVLQDDGEWYVYQ